MYRLIFFTVLGIAAMFAVAHLVAYVAIPDEEVAAQAAPAPPPRAEATGEETVIRRGDTGQFYLTAQANGRDASFLIDTGADFVALSPDAAENLDVDFDPSNFEAITRTASGVGMGQRVTIDHLLVADQEFRDVEAVVIDGLETNLLGQSVLGKLGQIELKGDEMVIRHPG